MSFDINEPTQLTTSDTNHADNFNSRLNELFDNDDEIVKELEPIEGMVDEVASAAVVDEGSTADGDYIRYENGWQICKRKADINDAEQISDGVIPEETGYSFAMPVSFSENQYEIAAFLASNNFSSGWEWQQVRIREDKESWELYNSNEIDVSGNTEISLLAIGRWE